MDHYHHPHNYGALPQPDADVNLVNTSCGDSIRVTVTSTGTTVKDVAFEGNGCVISTATASLLTDHIKGMSFDAVRQLTIDDILPLLGISLTPGRLKCAMLPLEGIHRAINTLEK